MTEKFPALCFRAGAVLSTFRFVLAPLIVLCAEMQDEIFHFGIFKNFMKFYNTKVVRELNSVLRV